MSEPELSLGSQKHRRRFRKGRLRHEAFSTVFIANFASPHHVQQIIESYFITPIDFSTPEEVRLASLSSSDVN